MLGARWWWGSAVVQGVRVSTLSCCSSPGLGMAGSLTLRFIITLERRLGLVKLGMLARLTRLELPDDRRES